MIFLGCRNWYLEWEVSNLHHHHQALEVLVAAEPTEVALDLFHDSRVMGVDMAISGEMRCLLQMYFRCV